jgi:hypothetical protein
MRVLVAFDKFKDSLTSPAACAIAADALRAIHPGWQFDLPARSPTAARAFAKSSRAPPAAPLRKSPSPGRATIPSRRRSDWFRSKKFRPPPEPCSTFNVTAPPLSR